MLEVLLCVCPVSFANVVFSYVGSRAPLDIKLRP